MGRLARLPFIGITSFALWYFFMRCVPITLNGGREFQQVLTLQEPDSPWHLHLSILLFFRACRI